MLQFETGLFVKNKISGVGFGMGDVTLENFLVTHALIPDIYKVGLKVLVTRFSDVPLSEYVALTKMLYDAGVAATLYLGDKKFGKQIDFAVKELDRDFFAAYTSAAIGEMEGIKRTPAPDTVYKALQEIGVDKTTAVYVGDSDVDIETAKNAGIPCISVSWGFRSVDELKAAGASVFAGSAAELATRLGL